MADLRRSSRKVAINFIPWRKIMIFYGRVAWWLATCARKPKVPGRVRLPAMRRGELSAAIARLMSKCL